MCVIIVKPSGTEVPSAETFEKCFSANSDGIGYMFTFNQKVHIRKGFMDLKSFYKDLHDAKNEYKVPNFKNIPMVFHFRITTQGGVCKELTHPFPIASDYETMRKLKIDTNFGVAHNGIIDLTSESDYSYGYGYGYNNVGVYDSKTNTYVKPNEKKYNDTMTFIKDYLSLIVGSNKYFSRCGNTNKLITNLLGGNYSNKLAILNSRGFIKLYGEFIKKNGLYFSNTLWDITPTTKTKTTTTSSSDFKTTTDKKFLSKLKDHYFRNNWKWDW